MRVHTSSMDISLTLILIFSFALVAMSQAPPPTNGTSEAPPPSIETALPPTTPIEGRTLRIAVPVSTYREFVSITTDNVTGQQHIGGFSIEVFQAVVNTVLNNRITYNLVPFARPDGSFNGSFDAMLQAVYRQEYDGAVGDTTIRYDRSQWVDFTLPYSETGITMMVSTRRQDENRTRIRLMPLIKGLVSAALVFCFVSALIFWFIEFRNDRSRQSQAPLATNAPATAAQRASSDDFWRKPRVSWKQPLYSVEDKGETMRAIIHTRLVIVVLFLVLLFLTSCYAASLTSLLTTQRQRSPNLTIDELIRTRAKVGNQQGGFVPRLLIQRGFLEDQIVIYNTEQEMVDMLAKGSGPGGVVAIIDETPYLQVFLSKNCNRGYALVPSFELQAEGFGFAFQRGSPLVREVSNGILRLMDEDQLATIRQRTIGNPASACQDDLDDVLNSNFLDQDTTWILFAGAIGVGILVIILYMVYLGTSCDTVRRRLAYPCYMLPNYQERKN